MEIITPKPVEYTFTCTHEELEVLQALVGNCTHDKSYLMYDALSAATGKTLPRLAVYVDGKRNPTMEVK